MKKKTLITAVILALAIVILSVGAVLLFDKSNTNENDMKKDTNSDYSEIVQSGGANPNDNKNEHEQNGAMIYDVDKDTTEVADKNMDVINQGYTYIYRDDQVREKVPYVETTKKLDEENKGGSSENKEKADTEDDKEIQKETTTGE